MKNDLSKRKNDEYGVVGLGNIRVLICPDEDSWFAQGVEIDYAAQGSSVEDVKSRFQSGLRATIEQNLRVYDSIDKLLVFTPSEIVLEMVRSKSALRTYYQVSFHDNGPAVQQAMKPMYDGIEYLVLKLERSIKER